MIIYSNILTQHDVSEAFAQARSVHDQDIWLCDISSHPARDYGCAIKVFAYSHHGRAASAHRPIGSYSLEDVPRAASWDAYGYVMAELYRIDPAARVGFYNSVAHFIDTCRADSKRKGSDVAFLDILTAPEALDARAQALGWADNAEMTHQAHNAPAFGCAHCASRSELDELLSELV